MPSLEGSRGTARLELCHALIIDTDRPSWVSHEARYGHLMVALCAIMSSNSSSLGTREVDTKLISLHLYAVSG